MLIEQIIPAIQSLFPNDFDHVCFQQHGAPAHFGLKVRKLRDKTFPDRWIKKHGIIE